MIIQKAGGETPPLRFVGKFLFAYIFGTLSATFAMRTPQNLLRKCLGAVPYGLEGDFLFARIEFDLYFDTSSTASGPPSPTGEGFDWCGANL